MRNITTIALTLVLASFAACSNNDSNNAVAAPSGNALVQSLVDDNTTDSAEPVEINDLDLQFSEDENAFSGLFD